MAFYPKLRFLITAGVLSVLTTSCGNQRKMARHKAPGDRIILPEGFEHEILTGEKPAVKIAKTQHDRLQKFIKDWEGTPHRMGGNTKRGVDCSGFVIQVFLQVYGINFRGRRAEDLFGETRMLKKNELQEGDLVFFKIRGRRIDHVGIYLQDGDFVHVSSSRGVMVSNLQNPYYQKRYFRGGRKT